MPRFDAAQTLRERLFVLLQYLLPQHLLSRAVMHLTRSRLPPLKRALIGAFVRHFRPRMDEALESDPDKYPTFNAFFTRALRPEARPIPSDPLVFGSPVDGTVSQIGHLEAGRIVQAKGHWYSLEALLAADSKWTARFLGGAFATLYLAPSDYHRIHMPHAGTLRAAWLVPGALFSVNAATAAAVPGLYARNERLVLMFADGSLEWSLILVGALFVGSLTTVWHGDVAPGTRRRVSELPVTAARAPLRLAPGAELARFNMGSTVIALLPPGAADWDAGIGSGRVIRMGQALGRLRAPPPQAGS
jgi:phosphatidylserine decarboxylase